MPVLFDGNHNDGRSEQSSVLGGDRNIVIKINKIYSAELASIDKEWRNNATNRKYE